jgi:hypothetical protein
MSPEQQTSAEELARAARLRRMAADLTAEARAIEAKYRGNKPPTKARSMRQILTSKGL